MSPSAVFSPPSVEIPDEEKLALLNVHRLSGPPWGALNDEQWCLQCAKVFTGRSVRVYRTADFPDMICLECGTPGCVGSPLDWHDPTGDFAQGLMARWRERANRGRTQRMKPDSDQEPCGEFGPQAELQISFRDAAHRERLRSVLWAEQGDPPSHSRIHPELGEMLCTAAKDTFRRIFVAAFGAAWLQQWKVVFRARVNCWENDPSLGFDCIQVEVEPDSEDEGWVGEEERVYALTSDVKTEQELLEDLRIAFVNYLNLFVPPISRTDKQITVHLEITGYGGG